MARKRKPSRGKKIKPQYWVFCEGATEASYVNMLKSKFRIPIEVVTRISGTRISESYIKRLKVGKPQHPKDRDFLMYDADRADILQNVKSIKNAILLLSNPSIELWFLLHFQKQKTSLNNKQCEEILNQHVKGNYKKGILPPNLAKPLSSNYELACTRAKALNFPKNPSSSLHVFFAFLTG